MTEKKGNAAARIFGHEGQLHGGASTLTLMTKDGTTDLVNRLNRMISNGFEGSGQKNGKAVGCTLTSFQGALPMLQQQQEGSLAKIAIELNVIILRKPDWDRQKVALGDSIYSE